MNDSDETTEAGTICPICPHHCMIAEGKLGLCRARTAQAGQIVCENYGRITSLALDPIEKKPLARFQPGSYILSVGSYGCNLRCPFCQNSEISFANAQTVSWRQTDPEELVKHACQMRESEGNIGIAYTYNEPLIGYEFVYDTAALAHERSLVNVLVTNGMICDEPLRFLLPHIDALNIDLKSFSQEGYAKLGGDLETVMNTIITSAETAHVEITTLVIPGFNDTDEEIDQMSLWLASIDPDIPYHLSRFFPTFQLTDRPATEREQVYHLADVAARNLNYVYTGNC